MSSDFLAVLNGAVGRVHALPRVVFVPGLHESADRWLAKKHANGAVHEPAMLAAFLAISERFPVRTAFDVGALFGYFTLAALNLFKGAEVAAFEAHPAACKELVKNLDGRQAVCVHALVGDEVKPPTKVWLSGFNLFEEPAGGWDRLPEIPGAMKTRGESNKGRGFIKVPFDTLDRFCLRHGVTPDLIKIDVEGYQAKAVRGAVQLLEEVHPIVVIELHDPEKLARFGTTNKATVQPLFDAGYRGYWCGDHRAADATFERVTEMGERHEKLSLMVFIPETV